MYDKLYLRFCVIENACSMHFCYVYLLDSCLCLLNRYLCSLIVMFLDLIGKYVDLKVLYVYLISMYGYLIFLYVNLKGMYVYLIGMYVFFLVFFLITLEGMVLQCGLFFGLFRYPLVFSTLLLTIKKGFIHIV